MTLAAAASAPMIEHPPAGPQTLAPIDQRHVVAAWLATCMSIIRFVLRTRSRGASANVSAETSGSELVMFQFEACACRQPFAGGHSFQTTTACPLVAPAKAGKLSAASSSNEQTETKTDTESREDFIACAAICRQIVAQSLAKRHTNCER